MGKKFFRLLAGAFSLITTPSFAKPLSVKYENGWKDDGSMTSEWATVIADRHISQDRTELLSSKKIPSAPEILWRKHIVSQAEIWKRNAIQLAAPFEKTNSPREIKIIFGNRGGDDGFTCGEKRVCIDLSSWVSNYGSPEKTDATRIERILSHEYTHLITQEWMKAHPPNLATPFDRALWQLFYEGLGNYHSLSSKWVTTDGRPTDVAIQTLEKNIPIFVERLNKLKNASSKEEPSLTKNLSSGPFSEKWGSTTIALWLSKETQRDITRLRDFITGGQASVLHLAERNLPKSAKDFFLRSNIYDRRSK